MPMGALESGVFTFSGLGHAKNELGNSNPSLLFQRATNSITLVITFGCSISSRT